MRTPSIEPGEQFGLLITVRFAHLRDKPGWWCLCACGLGTFVHSSNLRNGHTQSCGCFKRSNKAKTFRHGQYGTKLYHVWSEMIQRCTNPKNQFWPHYGGRGIAVCNEWRAYAGFHEDMAPTYQEGLCIDRRDNNGNYDKQNCYWATRAQQARNTTRVRLFTIEGKTQCLTDWAVEFGINLGTLRYRLRVGMPILTALTKKPS